MTFKKIARNVMCSKLQIFINLKFPNFQIVLTSRIPYVWRFEGEHLFRFIV